MTSSSTYPLRALNASELRALAHNRSLSTQRPEALVLRDLKRLRALGVSVSVMWLPLTVTTTTEKTET
jgi:hypothetical protein